MIFNILDESELHLQSVTLLDTTSPNKKRWQGHDLILSIYHIETLYLFKWMPIKNDTQRNQFDSIVFCD